MAQRLQVKATLCDIRDVVVVKQRGYEVPADGQAQKPTKLWTSSVSAPIRRPKQEPLSK